MRLAMRMRIAALILFLPALAFAQTAPTALPAACGPDAISFKVKTEKPPSAPAQSDPTKALVYFIQDDGPYGNHEHATLRVGMDGKWVGAYKHNSYFSVSVDPGEHHICVSVQQVAYLSGLVALAHFTAEQGEIYYFRTQLIAGMATLYPTPPHLDLDRPDSDQAKYLIDSFPIGEWQATK